MIKIITILLALVFGALSFAQPMMGGGSGPDKVALAKMEKSYKQTKAAFTKSPKDAKLKKSFIASTVKYGTGSMNAPHLEPRVKYVRALRLYREALKLDPKNKEALDNKKLIEDIYKSMGRPIPK